MDLTGIGTAVSSAKDILGMFFPDKSQEEKDKMTQAFQLIQLQNQADVGQIAANAAEGTGGLHFRDGAGWVCVAGLAVTVLRPLIQWGSVLVGHPVVLPEMDTTETMPMLLGLLGLGGMHAYQQVNGAK